MGRNTTFDAAFRDRWYRMPVTEQISNTDSEVARATCWKNKEQGWPPKGPEFLRQSDRLLAADRRESEKHAPYRRVRQRHRGAAGLFYRGNISHTTDEMLTRYYDAFLYRDRSEKRNEKRTETNRI